METCLVLTIISDDRPGVVERLATVIESHGGNWQESRMAHLDGKFAGILRLTVASAQAQPLKSNLQALSNEGIQVLLSEGQSSAALEHKQVKISAIGPDRPGIVLELSKAFAQRQLNVGQLDTDCSSMPWSGDPQFEAHYQLQVASDSDLDELQDTLDTIADDLALDIQID